MVVLVVVANVRLGNGNGGGCTEQRKSEFHC
jgi:hypothetical protein